MKRILIITAAALFISSAWIHSATPTIANALQENYSISSIRERYATINTNLAKYKAVKKELSGFSTEGGELTAYFDGASLMKIAITNQGETGRSFEDYYFWNDKLIFVFRKDQRYNEPYSGKVVKTMENRFYFNDDKLIRWIDETTKQVASSNGKYLEAQNQYLANARLFSEGARSQETMIEAPDRRP